MASIACLKPNVLTLSGACQQALGAVAGVTNTAATAAVAPPAAEPAPLLVTPREELFMLRTACGADYANFCRGLRPGAGRITACHTLQQRQSFTPLPAGACLAPRGSLKRIRGEVAHCWHQANVRYWHKADIPVAAVSMFAFGGKADIAQDERRSHPGIIFRSST